MRRAGGTSDPGALHLAEGPNCGHDEIGEVEAPCRDRGLSKPESCVKHRDQPELNDWRGDVSGWIATARDLRSNARRGCWRFLRSLTDVDLERDALIVRSSGAGEAKVDRTRGLMRVVTRRTEEHFASIWRLSPARPRSRRPAPTSNRQSKAAVAWSHRPLAFRRRAVRTRVRIMCVRRGPIAPRKAHSPTCRARAATSRRSEWLFRYESMVPSPCSMTGDRVDARTRAGACTDGAPPTQTSLVHLPSVRPNEERG